jgi:membrane protease YdiL (CAAX protease family)
MVPVYPLSESGRSPLALVKHYPFATYVVLAYAFSWAVEIPLALSAQGLIKAPVPFAMHYLASFGPLVAAVIVTVILAGRQGLGRLFGGLLKWRVGLGYILFSVLGPITLFAISVLITRVLQGQWPDLGLLGQVDYLPPLGLVGVLILWLLTFGLGEEAGWRAFALPRLQRNHSALAASLILGLIWGFWHLPAFFYRDSYSLMLFPFFLISLVAATIVFTWLYNGTRGSLLMVVLFHALFDLLSVSEAGGDLAANIMSAGVMIWAVLVVAIYKPANLARVEKQVA